MSTRVVECPHCHSRLKVPEERPQVRCPRCETLFNTADAAIAAGASSAPPFPVPPGRSSGAAPAFAAASPRGGSRTARSSARSESRFPSLQVDGPAVDPAACVESGTSFTVVLGWMALLLSLLALVGVTWGVGLIALLIAAIANIFTRRRTLAMIHGSGIKVGPEQFAEIDAAAETLWSRLGSSSPRPDIYVVEAPVLNAAAVRLGRRNLVLLTDDLIDGCLQSSDPRTLAFVLAHELGHAMLGHNAPIRMSMASMLKKLSRLDEHTADRIARRLIGSPEVAIEGIVLLTVGPNLLPYINYEALERQAEEVVANRQSFKAEKKLTHPLLLNRLHRALTDA